LKGAMSDADPELRLRAEELMKAGGVDPAHVEADVVLRRPGMLNLGVFRREVNPIFYRLGADGQACAKCHVNHTILRLAESPSEGKGLSGEELVQNYNSVMKV